ncbi:MAG TPA: hypothetical protein VLK65_21840 [Vicinamibacteria bacterium]|nr:hypothetical protein [Vicinamibacteria bacterium]
MSRLTRYALAVLASGLACGVETPDELAGKLMREYATLASDAEQRSATAVRGQDGWIFFGPELRHVSAGRFWGADAAGVSRARRPDQADPVPAILDFKKQLEAIGVELILVPVPPKSLVYPDQLSSTVALPHPLPRLDPFHQEFYDLLRREGLTVVDLLPTFLSDRAHAEGPLYCRQDTHWSGVGVVRAAEAIAETVRERPWFGALDTESFSFEWYSTVIDGDLRRMLGNETLSPEELRLRRIESAGPPATPVEPDPASPIVLVGDSHDLVFHGGDDMHATGSGLVDQLAYELGVPLDLVAVRGSGATPARVNLLRRAQRDPDYWTRKRLVIWCFAAREFTEADGWGLVPIAP